MPRCHGAHAKVPVGARGCPFTGTHARRRGWGEREVGVSFGDGAAAVRAGSLACSGCGRVQTLYWYVLPSELKCESKPARGAIHAHRPSSMPCTPGGACGPHCTASSHASQSSAPLAGLSWLHPGCERAQGFVLCCSALPEAHTCSRSLRCGLTLALSRQRCWRAVQVLRGRSPQDGGPCSCAPRPLCATAHGRGWPSHQPLSRPPVSDGASHAQQSLSAGGQGASPTRGGVAEV